MHSVTLTRGHGSDYLWLQNYPSLAPSNKSDAAVENGQVRRAQKKNKNLWLSYEKIELCNNNNMFQKIMYVISTRCSTCGGLERGR
jgi:hypothetical protein